MVCAVRDVALCPAPSSSSAPPSAPSAPPTPARSGWSRPAHGWPRAASGRAAASGSGAPRRAGGAAPGHGAARAAPAVTGHGGPARREAGGRRPGAAAPAGAAASRGQRRRRRARQEAGEGRSADEEPREEAAEIQHPGPGLLPPLGVCAAAHPHGGPSGGLQPLRGRLRRPKGGGGGRPLPGQPRALRRLPRAGRRHGAPGAARLRRGAAAPAAAAPALRPQPDGPGLRHAPAGRQLRAARRHGLPQPALQPAPRTELQPSHGAAHAGARRRLRAHDLAHHGAAPPGRHGPGARPEPPRRPRHGSAVQPARQSLWTVPHAATRPEHAQPAPERQPVPRGGPRLSSRRRGGGQEPEPPSQHLQPGAALGLPGGRQRGSAQLRPQQRRPGRRHPRSQQPPVRRQGGRRLRAPAAARPGVPLRGLPQRGQRRPGRHPLRGLVPEVVPPGVHGHDGERLRAAHHRGLRRLGLRLLPEDEGDPVGVHPRGPGTAGGGQRWLRGSRRAATLPCTDPHSGLGPNPLL